jgi:hypothetical protein
MWVELYFCSTCMCSWRGKLLTYLLTYSMEHSPSWEANRFSPSQKFPAFHGTRRFITAFTSARHLSQSWANYLLYLVVECVINTFKVSACTLIAVLGNIAILVSVLFVIFRRVRKIASCLSVLMKRLGFHLTDFHQVWYLYIFSKICRANSSFIKIWRE